MLPILQIGPIAIQLPGLLLLLGLWLGTLMSERAARQHQLSANTVSNMIFYGLIAGILGAEHTEIEFDDGAMQVIMVFVELHDAHWR